MKVIANIPEDMLQELKDGCFRAKHTVYDLAGAICNGVVLPDNATNGDVMRALFNETEYPKLIRLLMTSDSFWKALYKGGQKDGNDN